MNFAKKEKLCTGMEEGFHQVGAAGRVWAAVRRK